MNQKQQEACMHEQGAPDSAEALQEAEAGTGDPEGMQRQCPSMHGCQQDNKSPPGVESREEHEGRTEGFLQISQQSKTDM